MSNVRLYTVHVGDDSSPATEEELKKYEKLIKKHIEDAYAKNEDAIVALPHNVYVTFIELPE